MKRVAIIGAGLAGCALSASLIEKQWAVTLFDQEKGPAQGASALPVGLLSAYHSAQATAISVLSQRGWQMMLDFLNALPSTSPPQWALTPILQWNGHRHLNQPPKQQMALALPAFTLIEQWLGIAQKSPHFEPQWGTRIEAFEKKGPYWWLSSSSQADQGPFDALVLCNAYAAHQWLKELDIDIRPVAGQMSLGPTMHKGPTHTPGKCKGVYLPWYRGANPNSSGFSSDQALWTAGSTYRRGDDEGLFDPQDHEANRAIIARTYPQDLDQFDECQKKGTLRAWCGVRCTAKDRAPVIGPVSCQSHYQGLYAFIGLGSRGLSIAALGAQILSELMDKGHSQSLDSHWIEAIDPRRFHKGLK